MMTARGYVLREHVRAELGSIVALLCRNNVLNCERDRVFNLEGDYRVARGSRL